MEGESPRLRRQIFFSPRRAELILVTAFAALCVVFSGQFPPFANPNELTRLETVFACVEDDTFSIDRAIGVLGDHEDKASSGGRFYSNKAPGLALAAVPIYRALRIFIAAPRSAFDPIFLWLRVLVVSSLCTFAIWRFQCRLREISEERAFLIAAAVAFGTPYLYYARSFLSHAWCAGLVFLSWDLLWVTSAVDWRRRHIAAIISGLAAGWAAISEYPVALLGLSLALYAAATGGFGRFWRFALGALPPLALLLFYDKVCFGSPFVISSSREALPQFAALARRGLFGLEAPRFSVALAFLFHSARGVLLFCPFLFWVAIGFFAWWLRGVRRSEAVLCAGATILFFAALCGYSNWHGGWALGDRYLLPILLLAAVAIVYALDAPISRIVFSAAAAFSVAANALLCVAWPHFPLNVPWPPATGSLWFLARGWVAPGLLSDPVRLFAGLVLPLLVLVLALRSAASERRRAWVPLALGILGLGLTLIRPPQMSFGGRLWRAAVFGRFSGRDPERIELKRVMREASTPSERGRAADAWRLYGPEE